jgi:hypothetical protein
MSTAMRLLSGRGLPPPPLRNLWLCIYLCPG